MTILAKDFRKIARDSLRGRWGMAVGAGFVASLLGASTAITAGGGLNYSSTNSDVSTADYEAAQAQAQKIVDFLNSDQFVQNILPWLLGMGVVLLIWLLVNLIVGGAVTLGYAQFNLNLVDDRVPCGTAVRLFWFARQFAFPRGPSSQCPRQRGRRARRLAPR